MSKIRDKFDLENDRSWKWDGNFWLEKRDHDYYCLMGAGEYGAASVLEGNHASRVIQQFESQQEAEQETGLQLDRDRYSSNDHITMASTAPGWFDPADAGEEW